MSFASLVFGVKESTVLAGSRRVFAELVGNELRDAEELERIQTARHLAHIRFAYQHTRFYRDFYSAAGFTESDLYDPDVITSLPVIEKSHVRDHYADFVSDESTPKNSARNTTGGSTGEPLKLLRDVRFPARALEWRLFRWWGVRPYDNVAIATRHVKTAEQARRHAMQWWPSKRIQINAFDMTRESVTAFVEQWNRVRPNIMIGYVGAIAEFAGMLQDLGVDIASPRAVGVTAAALSANQRALIENVLRTKVYDHYRSSEVPWMAGECRHQSGLHVFSDVRALDIVDRNGKSVPRGELGETAWTDMTNRVFPLIRYRLGDRTRWLDGVCDCGVSLPRIQAVVGRVVEILHMPDGQLIAGEGLAQIFSATPDAVKNFQIIQHADFSIEILYVPGHARDAARDIEDGLVRFRQIVHDKVPVRGTRVTEIPHVGGKVRYLISNVPVS